jgi:phage portal protein BeeE
MKTALDLLQADQARSLRAGPVAKSFASTAASWRRGDDMVDGQATRLIAPYSQSAWVFAAINLVSGEFTGLPVKFYQGDMEVEDPALAAWWAAPALGNDGKRLSRAAVDQLLALHKQLHGEFFILLDDSWVVTAGRKLGGYTPFIIARPDRMRLVVRGGQLEGYVYTDPAGKQIAFVPEQVIHHMEPNPYDDWRGISRAQIAGIATEGAFLTGVYIRDLMRNNGDQGFIVVGKSGVADDNQRQQIVADLRAKRAALRAGIAKDLFLTGEITVDRPKEQAAGVDLTNTKVLSHQEVFITFGVPPSMSTVKQSYSVGKESDRYQLITGTSQPLARDIASAYADLATRQTGKALTADHDWDEHPVMQEVRRSRLEAALKLWQSGMSWQAINDYMDLGMTPFPGWEKAYLSFGLVEIGGGEPDADPTLAEAVPAEEVKMQPEIAQLKALLAVRTRTITRATAVKTKEAQVETDALAAFTCGCGCLGGNTIAMGDGYVAQKADRPPAEVARWRTHMQQRRDTVGGFKSAFGRVLMQARIETLRKIEGAEGKAALSKLKDFSRGPATDQSATFKSAATDLLFDLTKFTGEFKAAMRKQQQGALERSGNQLMRELGKDDPVRFAPQKVLQFLSQRENKLAGVPDQVHGRLLDSLAEGLQDGDSTAQLAARAKKLFNHMGDVEALRIAQSETSAAYGTGRHEAMREAGVQYKAWLTSGNDNVREAHRLAGLTYSPDTPIALDEPFVVDGEELMHPGDQSGSAGNTINCHCVQIAVAAPSK